MSVNLTDHNAKIARHIIVAGAHALLADISQVHYTQNMTDRWEAIRRGITIHGGRLLPFEGDCSSTATWLLWLALHHSFGLRDVVNGQNWKAGFTGTMVKHGAAVSAFHSGRIGDCVFYGGTHDTPEHVAVKIAPGHVFSHGGEAGPFFLPVDYRSDVHSEARRYFH
jgi:hypothetical protein